MPQALTGMAAAAINGKIYVAGGRSASFVPVTTLYIYDIATNSWSTGASMGVGRFAPAGTVVGGKLMVMGGGNPFTPTTLAETYDPATNMWTGGASLNVARYDAGAVTLDTANGPMALVVAGSADNASTSISSVEGLRDAFCTFPVISGRITYENAAAPVVAVPAVSLNAPGSPAVAGSSAQNGNYSLTGFGGGAYTVTPSKATQLFTTPNGIFSNDASLISRHVVGIQILNAAQQKAAMVGGGPGISSFDAGLVAQYIVGIPNVINQTGQWKFTPANRSYLSITSDLTNQDYAGTLMGDVSGDWLPPAPRPSETVTRPGPWSAATVTAPETPAAARKPFTVPLSLAGLAGEAVSSYQFTIRFDPAVITPAKAAASLAGTVSEGLSLAFHSPSPGVLNVVAYGAFPVTGEGIFVNLNFIAAGRPGTSTPLVITGFRLNDGTTPVTAVNGLVVVE
jgi:hypothetical protein